MTLSEVVSSLKASNYTIIFPMALFSDQTFKYFYNLYMYL